MKKNLLIILSIILIAVLLVVIAFSPGIIHAVQIQFQSITKSVSPTPSTPNNRGLEALISRNIPVFASSEVYPASDANSDNYSSPWRSNGTPAQLAYDLSKVPVAERSKVLVVWYNQTGNYDHTLIGYPAYNMPQDYTIEVNAAAGGGNLPATGWVTLVTVKGNHYHSRQHVITMTGYNWLRMNITAIDGSAENYDASINMDVYNASTVLADDWIFYGDSVTAGSMAQDTLNGTVAFAQLISAHVPNDYPVEESGGTSYLTSSDGVEHLKTWLQLFPGKYVGLSYGTNDALGCANPTVFYNNYVTMVHDVLQVGKIPLVPYIPWGRASSIQQCVPALNTQITKLYSAFPTIIHGPNLWSFFQSHQNLISNDHIHPNDDGFAAYRQQWANTMLTEVYHVNP